MPLATEDPPAGRPMVITHANCPDGWCCEWLFRRHFGESADYLSARYGDPVPDVTDRPHVYLADFSWKYDQMYWLVAQARGRVTILDHHRTAEYELANVCEIRRFCGLPEPTVVFDLNHSGAYLTWKYLKDAGATDPIFADGNPPLVVQYVQDRDLWSWRLPGSKEVNAALSSYPKVLEVWNILHEELATQDGYWDLFRQGAAILRAQEQKVEAAVNQAVEMTIAGHKVLVVNTTCHHSEIGERLAAGRPFGATFYEDLKRELRVWSFRSLEGGIDVSEVAKKFGGGGHRQAAGAQQSIYDSILSMCGTLPYLQEDQRTLAT